MMIEHIKNALWIDSIGLNPYSNGMMIELAMPQGREGH